MHSQIFQPITVMALWTMAMWLWMYATRIPAMNKAGIDAGSLIGGTGKDLDAVLPPKTQWIAHNYNHLHEQPTVFYAVSLAIAVERHDLVARQRDSPGHELGAFANAG